MNLLLFFKKKLNQIDKYSISLDFNIDISEHDLSYQINQIKIHIQPSISQLDPETKILLNKMPIYFFLQHKNIKNAMKLQKKIFDSIGKKSSWNL